MGHLWYIVAIFSTSPQVPAASILAEGRYPSRAVCMADVVPRVRALVGPRQHGTYTCIYDEELWAEMHANPMSRF